MRALPRSGIQRLAAAVWLTLAVPIVGVAGQEAPEPRGAGEAWAIEATGGTLGSLAGLGLGIAISRPDECGDELECILDGLAFASATSAAGAGLGAWGAGRWHDTEPSGWGAALGGIVGVVAGFGVLAALDEIDRGLGEGVTGVAAFGLTHGAVTALFTRIF